MGYNALPPVDPNLLLSLYGADMGGDYQPDPFQLPGIGYALGPPAPPPLQGPPMPPQGDLMYPQQADAHPGFTDLAYALQSALQGMPAINPQQSQGDQFGQAFLRGLAGGFSQGRVREDEARQKANEVASRNAAALNLLNAHTSAAQRLEQFKLDNKPKEKDESARTIEPGDAALIDAAVASGAFNKAQGAALKSGMNSKERDMLRTMKAPSGLFGSGDNQLTPAAQDLAARLFLATGQIPALGMGPGARVAVANKAATLDPNANIAASKADYAANTKSLSTLQTQLDQVVAYENTARDNAKVLQETMKSIPDAGAKPLNWLLREGAGQLGSDKVSAFNTALETVRPEFARILQSGGNLSGGGHLTDAAKRDMQATLDGTGSVKQLLASLNVLYKDAHNRRTNYEAQLNIVRGRLRGGSDASPPAPWHSATEVPGWKKMQLKGHVEWVDPARVADVLRAGGVEAR